MDGRRGRAEPLSIQSPLFSLAELATIAQRLDALEAAQLDGGVLPNGGKGHNYDDSGFFSVGVVDEALRVYGLRLVAWASEEMRPYHKHPEVRRRSLGPGAADAISTKWPSS